MAVSAIAVLSAGCSAASDVAENSRSAVGEQSALETDAANATAAKNIEWAPGHYILLGSNSVASQAAERDRLLGGSIAEGYAKPTIDPFAGIAAKYFWGAFETSEGDYSAGFEQLDADLEAVSSHGKKLVLFLNYKIFDNDVGVPDGAVPDYLQKSGPWCVTADGRKSCGQYEMSNGYTAMIWNPAVATRVHAWFSAIGKHVAASAHRDAVAGYVLPETASSSAKGYPIEDFGYGQETVVKSIEANISALHAADPTHIAFEYINFLPGPDSQQTFLGELATFALNNPGTGLGCPDIAPPNFDPAGFDPPGYTELMDEKYETLVPYNVAIETPDYATTRSPSIEATYDVAIKDMKAGLVTWVDSEKNDDRSFGIGEVASYIAAHPMPNTTRPTW